MSVPSRRARARGVWLVLAALAAGATLAAWALGRDGSGARRFLSRASSAQVASSALHSPSTSDDGRGAAASRNLNRSSANPRVLAEALGSAVNVAAPAAPGAPSERSAPVAHFAAEPLAGPLTESERARVLVALKSLDALRSLPGAAPLVDAIVGELRSGRSRPRWENLPRTSAGTRRLDPENAAQLFDDEELGAKFQELLRLARAHSGAGR